MTAWVLTTVVLLTASLGLLLVRLPQMLGVTAVFVKAQAGLLPGLVRRKNVGAGLLGAVRLATLAIPLTGFTTMLVRAIRRASRRSSRNIPLIGLV